MTAGQQVHSAGAGPPQQPWRQRERHRSPVYYRSSLLCRWGPAAARTRVLRCSSASALPGAPLPAPAVALIERPVAPSVGEHGLPASLQMPAPEGRCMAEQPGQRQPTPSTCVSPPLLQKSLEEEDLGPKRVAALQSEAQEWAWQAQQAVVAIQDLTVEYFTETVRALAGSVPPAEKRHPGRGWAVVHPVKYSRHQAQRTHKDSSSRLRSPPAEVLLHKR